MKLRIERDQLADAVAWAARTLPARPTNPVLSGVLLEATDDTVSLTSSDQAVSSHVDLDAAVGEPGSTVVSGRLLADIAKSLPAQPVSLALEGTRLQLTCGRASFTLPTLQVEEYPPLPAMPPLAGTIDGDELATAVGQVSLAASRDDTMPMLTGVRIEFDGDTITLAATDRYRLALRELAWRPDPGRSLDPIVVRGKTLADLTRPLAGCEVSVALDDALTMIGFAGAGRRSTTPLLAGDYPDYRKALPTESHTMVTMPTADFIEAVKRVKLVADRPHTTIQMDFADGEAFMRAGSGEDARATEGVECSLSGDPLTIAFNPEYLLDGLTAVDSDQVRIAMTESRRLAVFSPEGEDAPEYRYLLMPVRLPG